MARELLSKPQQAGKDRVLGAAGSWGCCARPGANRGQERKSAFMKRAGLKEMHINADSGVREK